MSDVAAFVALITRTGVGLPRGVLGEADRALAAAIVRGAPAGELERLRAGAAEDHWEALRLAIGAGLERAVGDAPDAVAAEALVLVLDERPDNPLALALAEEAGRSLAAVMERNGERLVVLERRLSDGAPVDADLALVIGQIVVDSLDLDPGDYEEEIAEYVRGGESEAARTRLARATGDVESREWAREELRGVGDADAPLASGAIAVLAAGSAPDDPAEDAVWVAAMLALVEEAVEFTMISDNGGGG
jgi:hypothetical protein